MMDAEPILVGVKPAAKAIIAISKPQVILHAGPPMKPTQVSGPMKGALTAALLYERWAETPETAARLISSENISLEPNHHHSCVGPMAGVITPEMPVFIVRDSATGLVAYTNMNEGLGRVMRMGAYDPDVVKRLGWMRDVLGPSLSDALDLALKEKDGIKLKPIIAQALHMGDECHNRNVAATSLFLREICPFIIATSDRERAKEAIRFIDGNNHFFVNLAMVASKIMADSAHGVEPSTIVSAISRNGTEIGVRISGLGDEWFTAPSPIPRGLYFPGFTAADANPDIGDSTITETVGLGAAAMAASPAIVQFVGGTVQDAIDTTRRMGEITIAKHKHFTIPYLDFEGTPTGIDFRKVLRTGITPRANTGIAHKEPGIGQIGAGIVEVPIDPFKDALARFAERYGI